MSVVAILAYQTLLLFFVYGPYGLIQLPSAKPLCIGALVVGVPAILSRRLLVRALPVKTPRSQTQNATLNTTLLPPPDGLAPPASLGSSPPTAPDMDDYVRAFEAWKKKEIEARRAKRRPGSPAPTATATSNAATPAPAEPQAGEID